MRSPNPPPRAAKPADKPAEETEEIGSDLWLLLTKIPRPWRRVPFPRNLPGTKEPAAEVAIWPLTHGELIESNAAAEERLKKLFQDGQKQGELNLGYNHSFANEVAIQQLWRACRDPEDIVKPAFPSPKAMSLRLTGDEIGVLYNHYLTTQAELGPITARMSDEEYEAWVRRIAKSGSADPLDGLSWELQRTLLVTMASQLAAYWTDTSSPGSPQDESTTPQSSEDKASNVSAE